MQSSGGKNTETIETHGRVSINEIAEYQEASKNRSLTALAKRYEALGKYRHAITLYELALNGYGEDLNEINYCLANLYFRGKGVREDIDKALTYLTAAINRNTDKKICDLLREIYDENTYKHSQISQILSNLITYSNTHRGFAYNFSADIYRRLSVGYLSKAYSNYMEAAKYNYGPAFLNLGELYLEGLGVPQDSTKALTYFKKALAQGETKARDAITKMGQMPEVDLENKNYDLARTGFLSRAQNGDASALLILGQMYRDGLGVPADAEIACEYFNKALEKGLAKAKEEMIKLGRLPHSEVKGFKEAENNPEQLRELGLTYSNNKQYPEALTCFEAAAKLGDGLACFELGEAYRLGHGVAVDKDKAATIYYPEAIKKNILTAASRLGTYYYNKSNYVKAFELYKLDAEQGSGQGYYNLGDLYRDGKGVKQDTEKAVEHYQIAFAKGVTAAKTELEKLNRLPYSEIAGFNEAKDDAEKLYNLGKDFYSLKKFKEANTCFEEAAKKGHNPAMTDMGTVYFNEGKTDKAEQYYETALKKGNIGANTGLGHIALQKKQYSAAFDYFKLGLESGNGYALIGMGDYYMQKPNNNNAYLYFELGATSTSTTDRLEKYSTIAQNQVNMAAVCLIDAYRATKNFKQAEIEIDKAISILKNNANDNKYQYLLALKALDKDQPFEAIRHFTEAEKLTREQDDPVLIIKINLHLAKIYETIEDYQDVMCKAYIKAHQAAKDFPTIRKSIGADLQRLHQENSKNTSIVRALAEYHEQEAKFKQEEGKKTEAEADIRKSAHFYLENMGHDRISALRAMYGQILLHEENKTKLDNCFKILNALSRMGLLEAEVKLALVLLKGQMGQKRQPKPAIEQFKIALNHALAENELVTIQQILHELLSFQAIDHKFTDEIDKMLEQVLSSQVVYESNSLDLNNEIKKIADSSKNAAIKDKAKHVFDNLISKLRLETILKERSHYKNDHKMHNVAGALEGKAEDIVKLAKYYKDNNKFGRTLLMTTLASVFEPEEKQAEEYRQSLNSIEPNSIKRKVRSFFWDDDSAKINKMKSFLQHCLTAKEYASYLPALKVEYKIKDPIILIMLALQIATDGPNLPGITELTTHKKDMEEIKTRIKTAIKLMLTEDLMVSPEDVEKIYQLKLSEMQAIAANHSKATISESKQAEVESSITLNLADLDEVETVEKVSSNIASTRKTSAESKESSRASTPETPSSPHSETHSPRQFQQKKKVEETEKTVVKDDKQKPKPQLLA